MVTNKKKHLLELNLWDRAHNPKTLLISLLVYYRALMQAIIPSYTMFVENLIFYKIIETIQTFGLVFLYTTIFKGHSLFFF